MRKVVLLILIICCYSCLTFTKVISEKYVVGDNLNLVILDISYDFTRGTAYFNNEEGNYVSINISLTNSSLTEKQFDLNKFSVDNSELNFRLPLHNVETPVLGWIAGNEKEIKIDKNQTKRLTLKFITPKTGKVNALYYENQKFELKLGETKEVFK